MGRLRHGVKNEPEAGFTLLEVITVLAIAGLLFGLVLPELGAAAERMRLYAGVRQVVAVLNYAREAAIAGDYTQTVEIDFGQGRLALASPPATSASVTSGEGQTGAGGARTGLEGATGGKVAVLPDGLRLGLLGSAQSLPAGPALKFFPDGTSNGIQLVITDRRGNRFLIEVNAVTGRIQARKDGTT